MFSIVDIAVDVVAVVVVVEVIGFAFLHLNLAIKETSYDPKYHQTLEQQTLMAIFERAPNGTTINIGSAKMKNNY